MHLALRKVFEGFLVLFSSLVFSVDRNSHVGCANQNLPNVVIILTDDLGWGDLGVHGEPSKETPNIDKMAAEGMLFTEFYTASPVCSPARASLLTGRLPIRNGFYTTNAPARNAYSSQEVMGGISDGELLLSEMLAKFGYENKIVGKWHLGHRPQYLPLQHGFHHWFGSPQTHPGPFDDATQPNIPVFKDDKMIGRYYEEFQIIHNATYGYSEMTKLQLEEVKKYITTKSQECKQFFVYWAPDSTHTPVYASNEYINTSRRGIYGDAVREIDSSVGEILATLNSRNIQNNTFVFFTSDNGAALYAKFQAGSNGPLLCGKQTTFEGGTRVPGIAYWPGKIPAGTVSHQVGSHMDLLPTIVEMIGQKIPQDLTIDGINLSDALFQQKAVRRPLFHYRGDLLMAVRYGIYKIHLWTWTTPKEELEKGMNHCPDMSIPNVTTTMLTDHTEQPVMFHLGRDPGERYPLHPTSAEYQEQLPVFRAIIDKHDASLVPAKPQLDFCDKAVMNWAPPGCEDINKCLPSPPSHPYRCIWPH